MEASVQTIIQFLPVAFFSVLAFWKSNAALFMLAGGISLLSGLYWYDQHSTPIGMGVGLSLIVYWLVCWGFAFKTVFWRGEE